MGEWVDSSSFSRIPPSNSVDVIKLELSKPKSLKIKLYYDDIKKYCICSHAAATDATDLALKFSRNS